MVDETTDIDRAVDELAKAIAPHVSEFGKRDSVAAAVSRLREAIAAEYHDAIAALEARVAGLEKDTHPAVPLRPIIIQEVAAAMKRLVHRPRIG